MPLSLGLSDGILNSLVLATTAILGSGATPTLAMAGRVGCVALATALVTMYVAQYAELRVRLERATDTLSLSRSGRLATTALGRRVRLEALQAAVLASCSSFAGATLPLLVAGVVRQAPWSGLLVAEGLLALLGAVLAGSVKGNRTRWAVGLSVAGIVVAAIGSQLKITS